MMRIRIGELRRLIGRALLHENGLGGLRTGASGMWLAEADDDDEKDKDASDPSNTDGKQEGPSEGSSLDAQVDHYLIEYEKSAGKAKKAVRQTEGRRDVGRAMTRRFLLREADDAESSEANLPADVGGPADRGAVDVEEFASSVARLIENFDSLVEVKRTILRRAEDFMRKSHSDDDVQRFLDSMRDQHGIDPDESEFDREADIEAPPAVGAGVPPGGG